MKKSVWSRLFMLNIVIMLMFPSCQNEKWPGHNEIVVSWEVLSNTYDQNPGVKALFTITNNSSFELNSGNWKLYFNQSPRVISSFDTLSRMNIRRINGDWYEISPADQFLLLPGENAKLLYENTHWWIKESDAPAGLYFVFTDNEGNETLATVNNYRLLPFTREEQYTRHLNDHEPFPSPEWLYSQNELLAASEVAQEYPIIPTPFSYVRHQGVVELNSGWKVCFGEELKTEAAYLQQQFTAIAGIETGTCSSPGAETIRLSINNVSVNGKSAETYRLRITDDKVISIEGSDAAGVFYGIQSLLAMIDPAVNFTADKKVNLPVATIEDAPRFGYRGIHIDVSRNFRTQKDLLKIIDILAFYKINTLHLHLTDDEGWRLEIAALPELTTVGAWRGHTTKDAPALHPAYGSGPFKSGGFYSRAEYVELLQYARQRHIKVIPEINLPGHSRAAIKSMEARYNRLMSEGNEEAANEYRLIDPEETSVYLSAQLFTDVVVNVARESVYRFLTTVLDEVIDMYREADAPLDIVHIGGDEVPAGAWTKSPMIDRKMQDINVDLHANMHAAFTTRAREIFRERGLKMAGWEEVAMLQTKDGLHVPNPEFTGGDIIPFIWNNLWGAQDLAYRMANRGYPVVLCHVTAFYFDLANNKDPLDPGLYWGGFVDTRSAWHYNPYDVFKTTTRDNMGRTVDIETEYRNMERLLPAARPLILGLQAQLWSETIKNNEMLQSYLLPKLTGLAESAWAPARIWETTSDATLRKKQTDEQWNRFASILGQRELPRLSYIFGGYNYRIPPPGAIVKDGMLMANTEFPGLIVRYTLDGTEPDSTSPAYNSPVALNGATATVAAFDLSGNRSRSFVIPASDSGVISSAKQ
jgi:hexosaminidase